MKLNKEICIKCIDKNSEKKTVFPWHSVDEERWYSGKVCCPSYKHCPCPYELEHIVSGNEEITLNKNKTWSIREYEVK